MSKAFTIHSAYHEINGDYLEYDIRDYGEAGIKKSYRNKYSGLYLFYNNYDSTWWIHDEYNATLRTKDKSSYNGLGTLHVIGYLSDDLHGQLYYSNENLHNRTGLIPSIIDFASNKHISKAFTICSEYNEINGDYFENDLRDYEEAGIKKSYRNEDSSLFFFYNKYHSAWWFHDEYNATLRTKDKSSYKGLGTLHAFGYLTDSLHGQIHYSDENLYNKTGPILNIDKSIPSGYILSKNDKYTILAKDDSYIIAKQNNSNNTSIDFVSNNLYKAIDELTLQINIERKMNALKT